jgi:peptidylprolyl isomerase
MEERFSRMQRMNGLESRKRKLRIVRSSAALALVALGCRRPASQSFVIAGDASTVVTTQDGAPEPPTALVHAAPAPQDVAAPPSDATKAPNGVAMKVLRPGRGGDRPKDDDCVKLGFLGWNREGTLLVSSPSEEGGSVQCLRQVVPGIVTALQAMSVGEERRVWVPADLAFATNDHDRTAPKVDMTFDVTLLDLMKAPPVPKDLKAPPRSATRLPSGLALLVLKKGTGTEHPSDSSRVTLHFSGWKGDGTLFETTIMSNHPASYTLGEVIVGWREALLQMVAGEKARVWIPAALAYGEAPRRRGVPAGDLVYELELLTIE